MGHAPAAWLDLAPIFWARFAGPDFLATFAEMAAPNGSMPRRARPYPCCQPALLPGFLSYARLLGKSAPPQACRARQLRPAARLGTTARYRAAQTRGNSTQQRKQRGERCTVRVFASAKAFPKTSGKRLTEPFAAKKTEARNALYTSLITGTTTGSRSSTRRKNRRNDERMPSCIRPSCPGRAASISSSTRHLASSSKWL